MSRRSWLVRAWGSKGFATIGTLPLVMGLVSCAGTPWGERLSSSFPPPQEQQAPDAQPGRPQGPEPIAAETPLVPPPEAANAPPSKPAPVAPGPATSRSVGSKAQAPTARQVPAPPPKPSRSPSLPSPYRVTLRLPQADPSAPAEGVTQALRAAGIPFEVETIERAKGIPPVPPTEASSASQAPPSVRPAPPPR